MVLNRLAARVAFVALTAVAFGGLTDRWAVLAPAQAAEISQDRPNGDESRPEDRAAIRSAMQAFVKAFEARDAKALAAQWTVGGEFQNERGVTIRGRDALLEGFTKFFAATPEVTAQVEPATLRFLSRDAAIEEGTVSVQRGPAEPKASARYTALYVREEGRWLLASLIEDPADAVSIDDLAWLIGEWRSVAGQGTEIRTTYSWAPGKKFIRAEFTLKEKEIELSGSQMIGVDPETGSLHTWTFEADGGVAEADWTSDGNHWILEAVGTLPDGSTLIETNILRRVDNDTFTWQSIDRTLDDESLDDLPPVRVTRVKAEK